MNNAFRCRRPPGPWGDKAWLQEEVQFDVEEGERGPLAVCVERVVPRR